MARDGLIPDVFPFECAGNEVRWETGYIAIDNILINQEATEIDDVYTDQMFYWHIRAKENE